MPTIRGRAVQIGGMETDAGANARTDDNNLLTRPAYRYVGGAPSPIPATLGIGHPLLDLSTVGAWRLIAVAVAVAYIVGFHVTLGRARLGIGPGR
ncbi:MAG TPA: hypothetical protein VEQ15_00270 [Myxococcales bacterium]|nr:hypothetical protein [Myxococcales bacterium]